MNLLRETSCEHGPGSPSSGSPTVAVIASQTATVTKVSPASENPYEEDVHVRAETITVVLSKILEQPSVFRNWGINE